MSIVNTHPRHETTSEDQYPTTTSRVPILSLHTDKELIKTIQSATEDADNKDTLIGYQTCSYCQVSPEYTPSPCCDCTPIHRVLAGSTRLTKEFDTIFRIAEKAVIEHWAPNRNTPSKIIITKSAIVGRLGRSGEKRDEHTVKIEFEGQLNRLLNVDFISTHGEATIKSICGDGGIYVGVKLFSDKDPR
jgi:hypothetical protein